MSYPQVLDDSIQVGAPGGIHWKASREPLPRQAQNPRDWLSYTQRPGLDSTLGRRTIFSGKTGKIRIRSRAELIFLIEVNFLAFTRICHGLFQMLTLGAAG